jgi:hypothetical protein
MTIIRTFSIAISMLILMQAHFAHATGDIIIDSFEQGPQSVVGSGNYSGPLNGTGSNKGTTSVYDGPGPIGDRRELVAGEGHPTTSVQTISGTSPGTSSITWSGGSNGATNQSLFYGSAIRPAPVSLNVDLSAKTAFEVEFADLKPGVFGSGNGWIVQVFIDTTGPQDDPDSFSIATGGAKAGDKNFTWCGNQHPHPIWVVMTSGCYFGQVNLPPESTTGGPVIATIDFSNFGRWSGFGWDLNDTLTDADLSSVHGITFSMGNNGNFSVGNNDRVVVLAEIRVVNNNAPPDADEDGVLDGDDNCPATANADQFDLDGDGAGDACDDDDDNDGVLDGDDVCRGYDDNVDVDGDGIPNGCDTNDNDGPLGDLDGDSVSNENDSCDGTATGEVINLEGCSVVDLCDCNAKSHGNYVSCTARTASDFRRDGLISKADKSALVKAAARSHCGK